MKISVIIKNYNYSKYLPDAIESILNQTIKADEFIIIDDGSTDESQKIIQAYADQHPEITFLKNEKNIGICATTNKVIPLAKYDYVTLLASDDIYLPNYIEETKKAYEKFPHACLFCSDFAYMEDENTKEVTNFPKVFTSPETTFLMGHPLIKAMRTYKFWISSPACFRRDLFYKFKGYISDLEMYMDFFLLAMIAFDRGVCYIPKTIKVMRVHGSQFSSTLSFKKKKNAWKNFFDKFQTDDFKKFKYDFKKSHLLYHWETPLFYYLLKNPRYWSFADYSLWKKLGIQWRRRKVDPLLKKLTFKS